MVGPVKRSHGGNFPEGGKNVEQSKVLKKNIADTQKAVSHAVFSNFEPTDATISKKVPSKRKADEITGIAANSILRKRLK